MTESKKWSSNYRGKVTKGIRRQRENKCIKA